MTEKKRRFSTSIIVLMLYFLGLMIFLSIIFKPKKLPTELLETDTGAYTISVIDTVSKKPYHESMNQSIPISKSILLGKHSRHEKDSILVVIDPRYCSRAGMQMDTEAYEAFLRMHAAAKADGISLTIISAWRSFDRQKTIWEDKWNGRQALSGNIRATGIADPAARAREILRYSSMPGTSRHHWGTDIDINNLNNSYFSTDKGKQEYEWLRNNAARFGFCQPYTSLGERNNMGYEEEKWHWSYMPVSGIYLNVYNQKVNISDLIGFDGFETAGALGVISSYVNSINKKCMELSTGTTGE